jgi:hypothetical protein
VTEDGDNYDGDETRYSCRIELPADTFIREL